MVPSGSGPIGRSSCALLLHFPHSGKGETDNPINGKTVLAMRHGGELDKEEWCCAVPCPLQARRSAGVPVSHRGTNIPVAELELLCFFPLWY